MTRPNLAVKDGLLFIHFKKSMLHSFEDFFSATNVWYQGI